MSYYWKILRNYYSYSEIKRGSLNDILHDFITYRNNNNYSFLEVLNVEYKRNKQTPIRLYLDIDGLDVSTDKMACTIINIINRQLFYFLEKKGIIKTIKEDIYRLFRNFKEKIKTTYNKSSNTHKGYSFHIIYPVILDNIDAKIIKLLIKDFKIYIYNYFKTTLPLMSDDVKHIDINVYSKNRLFRGIMSYQPGIYKCGKFIPRNNKSCHIPCKVEDRDLIILKEEEIKFMDYIIQYTDNIITFNKEYINISKIKEYENYEISNKIIIEYNKIFGNQNFGSQKPYVITEAPKAEEIKEDEEEKEKEEIKPEPKAEIKQEEKEQKEIKEKEKTLRVELKTEIKQYQETNVRNLLILMIIMNIIQIFHNIIFK